jgi:cell division protein FtsB
MNKTELLSTYTAEQLAGMVINLQGASEVKNDEIHKLKWQISSLEEENGRLQAKLDTYNEYLLPRCTEEARRMIDKNSFAEVRIVTWDEWNNREKAEGEKVLLPKEYESYIREILNIDASEIKDDCHRFGIESLQRYLKIPAPIKIPKRDSENIGLSKIQKCQEEYEKLLKESPIQGIADEIEKDILKQKNNAMAMEFTKAICGLLEKNGVRINCTETKHQNIMHNLIEEKYGIMFDSVDFSKHDKEFTDKIEELKKENDELKAENAELHCEMQAMSMFPDEIPTEPIKIADMLISATYTRQKSTLEKTFSKAVFGNNSDTLTENVYSKSELRQIAEHLLVYCNHNVEDGNEAE